MHPWTAQLPDDQFLLFVGDISTDKGVDILLEAYRTLEHAPPLVLIGRYMLGPDVELPEYVTYLGSWPHEAVMAAWRRSMIALVPSVWHEPFGIVAIEAMAMGCPIIASRTGGLIDIVADGENGILVPPGDAEALRNAIATLLAQPALRMSMAKASLARATAFSASTVVPRIEQVYLNCLSRVVTASLPRC